MVAFQVSLMNCVQTIRNNRSENYKRRCFKQVNCFVNLFLSSLLISFRKIRFNKRIKSTRVHIFLKILKTWRLVAGRIEKGSKNNFILMQNINDFTRN